MFIGISYVRNEFEFKLGDKICKKTRKKKIYHLSCDNCSSEFERTSNNFSPKRANNNFKHFCNECGDSQSFAGKIGQIGNDNRRKSLLGTKIVDSSGYLSLYVGPEYKYSNTYGGRIREHIYLIQEKIGRQILKEEVVHHIDGNKLNNDISNLDLCSITEHNNCHAKSEKIVFELYKMGIVSYDREKKLYILEYFIKK
jgi:hypothetical protein